VLALFLVILLHEFGHCFAARWTGGGRERDPHDPARRAGHDHGPPQAWPTFVTVAGGPAVNVIICLLCGLALYLMIGIAPLTPNQFVGSFKYSIDPSSSLLDVADYLFFIYGISYYLLLFNLLPVFPLDGGQLLQSVLWKPMGYYKSMLLALNVGLVGAALMMMVGIATFGTLGGGLLLTFIGLNCLMNCYQMKTMMTAEGPWAFSNEDEPDYGGGAAGTAATAERPSPTRPSGGRRPAGSPASGREGSPATSSGPSSRRSTTIWPRSAPRHAQPARGEKKALRRRPKNQRKRDQLPHRGRHRRWAGE
jgi:hypothetical protein